MTKKDAIKVFEDKKIRAVWDDQKEEWYFSIVDVIEEMCIRDSSYTIEGNTKGGRYFYSKATHKKAYEREIIVTVKLKYTDSRRKEVEKLLPNIFKYVSTNEL